MRAHGLSVACGFAEKLPVGDSKLDVAVALDVLEHLDDDRRALTEILRVLRPEGVLLATVPAYPFLWSSHDEALDHRRRYRRAELRERLAAAGFEITLCSHVVASILPVVFAVRLSERWWRRRGTATSGYMTLPRPLNVLLARLVSLGGDLVRFVVLPFGLSIVAVARKPAASGRKPARSEPQASEVHPGRPQASEVHPGRPQASEVHPGRGRR